MALSTQNVLLAKRRAGNYLGNFGKPFSNGIFKWLFSFFSQFTAGVDMQVSEFATATSVDIVLADAACKLYAFLLVKATATAGWFKATDHATTCSTDGTQTISVKVTSIGEAVLIFAQGLPLAAGLTIQNSTTATGATGSAANGCKGFALIGPA